MRRGESGGHSSAETRISSLVLSVVMLSVTTPVARAAICQPGKVSIVGHSDAIT